MINKNIILTIILIIFLLSAQLVISSTLEATNLFISKVFTSVFPFMILSDVLIYFKYDVFLSKTFGNFLSKVFNISKSNSDIIILSVLSSHPSNAIFIKDKLDKSMISVKEAEKIFSFTLFPSIMFVIGTVGIGVFNSFKIGVILLLNNYLCNAIIGLFMRNKYDKDYEYTLEYRENESNFFKMLKEAIIKGINTCFVILGNIVIFTTILNIFNNYISLPPILNSVFSGMFEMTNGIVSIGNLNLNNNLMVALVSFVLNFSGISIFFQGSSILSPYKFNYKKILVIKLIFSALSSIFMYFVF